MTVVGLLRQLSARMDIKAVSFVTNGANLESRFLVSDSGQVVRRLLLSRHGVRNSRKS